MRPTPTSEGDAQRNPSAASAERSPDRAPGSGVERQTVSRPAPDGRSTPVPARADAAHTARPAAERTAVERARDPRPPSPYHSRDHRYARPAPHHVRAYPDARHAPPPARYYSARYTHWWVHPYYRWVHATVAVVTFNYAVHAWLYDWSPPARAGWVWVPGHYDGWWVPGHWTPAGPAPASWGSHWVYVPGWWVGDTYIEGYWRIPSRGSSWAWRDGRWTADGTYVWGHWEPNAQAPAGYVWEAGYWDGADWIEGFWRPAMRKGYRWVSAAYDEDGIYEGGYWEPMEDRPGSTWIPGWFDGNEWVDGYWVSDVEYRSANPDTWAPAPGLEDGWDDAPAQPSSSDEQPLALPVSP